MTQAMRFDITARDGASTTFDKVQRAAEKLRRELVRLDTTNAAPKLRVDGVEQGVRDVERLRDRLTRLSDTRVRVRVDIDAAELTPLQQRLNALSDRTVNVRYTGPSTAEITRLRRLTDALNELRDHQNRRIRLSVTGLDPATPSLIRRTARYLAELKAVGDVRIRVDIDGAAEALAALLAIRAQLRGLRDRRIEVGVRGAGAAATTVLRLGRALAALAVPGSLAAGVTSIGALTVSVGALLGVLGLVPGLALAAGAGIGTLLLGLGGVGNAMTKLAAADEAAATGAGSAAAAREAAAERIRSATEALADAEQAADRQSIDGARAVADARQALADARVSAAEQIADAERAVADAQRESAERVARAQQALADAEERARDSVLSAQRDVADARDRAADAAEQAADRVADAERDVARAQVDRLDAQRDLTRAIEDATEAQEDLDLALRGGALSEERAVLRLAEAQERLQEARAQGVSGRELQELDLDAREAALTLDEARERYVDLQQEASRSASAGIDGAAGVVDARRRVGDAIERERDAEAALADAREAAREEELAGAEAIARARESLSRAERQATRDVADARAELSRAEADGARQRADAERTLARARRDGAREVADAELSLARTAEQAARQQADAADRVADAQREVARALADTGAAASAAGIKADAALADLAPNAQELVRTLRALRPAWDDVRLDVQQRYLAGIAGEVEELAGLYLPRLKTGLGGIADSFNRGVRAYADWAKQSDTLADTDAIFRNLTRAAEEFEPAGTNMAAALTDVGVVGTEILPELSAGFTDSTERAREFIEQARRSGELEAWIRRGIDAASTLGSVLGNTGGVLASVFDAADEAGLGFLETADRATGALDDFLNSARGERALVALFTEARDGVDALIPGISTLGGATADMVAEFSNTGGIESSGRALSNIAEIIAPLLPMLGELAGETLDNLADGADMAGRLLTPVVEGTGALLDFLGPVAPAAAAMGAAFLVLGPVNALVTTLGVKMAALLTAMGLSGTAAGRVASGFSRVGSTIPVIGAALVGVGLLMEEFGSKADTSAGKVLDGSQSIQQAIAEEAAQLSRGTWHWDEDAKAKEINRIATENVTREIREQYQAMTPMEKLQADVALAQSHLTDEITRYGRESPQARAAQDALTGAVDRQQAAQQRAGREMESTTDAMKRQRDEAHAAVDAQFAYERAVFAVEDAQQRVNEAQARGAEGARDLERAELDLREAQVGLTRAAGDLAGAQGVQTGATDAATAALDAEKEAAFQLAETARGPARDAALRLAASLADSGSAADRARLEALGFEIQVRKIPGRADTLLAVHPETGEVITLHQAINNLPRRTNLVIETTHYDIYATPSGQIARHVGQPRYAGIPARADGGILPGYTPGRDVHLFTSPTGGALLLSGGEAVMRPEWTRAVGEDWIDDANAAARTGGVEAVRRFMVGDGLATGGVLGTTGSVGRGGAVDSRAVAEAVQRQKELNAAVARFGQESPQAQRASTALAESLRGLGVTQEQVRAAAAGATGALMQHAQSLSEIEAIWRSAGGGVEETLRRVGAELGRLGSVAQQPVARAAATSAPAPALNDAEWHYQWVQRGKDPEELRRRLGIDKESIWRANFEASLRAAGYARGGILPGYTPGRDIGLIAASGGEAVMRPEWTTAVGRGFVESANAAARSGGIGGARRFMSAIAAPRAGMDVGPIVAGLAALRADLRQVRRELHITQNFHGVATADMPAKLAQVERTNAEMGVFGA